MRRTGASLALLLLVAGGAAGQQPSLGDVPAGSAVVRGRVVHDERPEAAAGVDVILYSLSPGGQPGVRRTRSDDAGRFVFEGVGDDPQISYLVGANYGGIPYPGARLVFSPGTHELSVEVRIAELTDDPGVVRVELVRSRVERLGNRLHVQETVTLRNPGTRTYFVPSETRAPGWAGFETELPAGAGAFAMPLGVVPDGVVLEGERLAFYGPIYPGPQELSYSYALPVEDGGGDLSRRFGRAVERVEWWLPETGLTVERSSLGEPEPHEEEARRYLRHTRNGVASGERLELVVDAPGLVLAAGAVALPERRIFLELDDAAVLAREEYRLEVAAAGPAVGGPEAPLLHVPLPQDAYSLRFHPDLGLQPSSRGGIDVLGPIPPGESVLEILYRVPRTSGVVELGRSVSLPNPLLSLYVADTGLVVSSERLHRKRPVRTPDRLYMHFEAFEVEAGEEVSLRLEPLAPRRGLPRGLGWGLALALGLGSVAFLTVPLRGSATEAPGPEVHSPARRERESVVEAIRDLEHDYETGKVSEADYASFRDELRARALALLREERLESERARTATPEAPRCPSCEAEQRPGDRFCAQCGTRLSDPEEPGQEARR